MILHVAHLLYSCTKSGSESLLPPSKSLSFLHFCSRWRKELCTLGCSPHLVICSVAAFWVTATAGSSHPSFYLSSHRCPTYTNILESFLVHQKWSFLIVLFLFHYWFLKLSRKEENDKFMLPCLSIGSPEGFYRYKSKWSDLCIPYWRLEDGQEYVLLRSRKIP